MSVPAGGCQAGTKIWQKQAVIGLGLEDSPSGDSAQQEKVFLLLYFPRYD